jgi:hypothetical protein
MFQDEFSPSPVSPSGWDALAPNIKADLIFLLPFILADFFNYYSAGVALVVSGPVMFVFFLGSGALSAYFAVKQGRTMQELPPMGAVTGAGLWLVSTVINVVIGLFLGTVSLGTTLLLGLPYLCICAPFNLVGGAILGAAGAWLYSLFVRQ